MIDAFLGAVIGFLTSATATVVVWQLSRPKLNIAQWLSHTKEGEIDVLQTKVLNPRRSRATDIAVSAMLFLPADGGTRIRHAAIELAVSPRELPQLGGRSTKASTVWSLPYHRVTIGDATLLSNRDRQRLPAGICRSDVLDAAGLLRLLQTEPRAYLQIALIASDAILGARRAVLSPAIDCHKVQSSKFASGPSLVADDRSEPPRTA
jgi:hypothetical protein